MSARGRSTSRRGDHGTTREPTKDRLMNLVEELIEKNNQLHAEHQQETKRIHAEHHQEIQKLGAEHRQETKRIHAEHRQETKRIHAEHHQETKRIHAEHHQEIQNIHAKHHQETKQIHAEHHQEIQKIGAGHHQEIQKIGAEHHQETKRIHAEHHKEIQNIHAEHQNIHAEHHQEIQRIDAEHQQQTKRIHTEHHQEIQNIHAKHHQETKQIHAEHHQEIQNIYAEHQQLQLKIKDQQHKIENLNMEQEKMQKTTTSKQLNIKDEKQIETQGVEEPIKKGNKSGKDIEKNQPNDKAKNPDEDLYQITVQKLFYLFSMLIFFIIFLTYKKVPFVSKIILDNMNVPFVTTDTDIGLNSFIIYFLTTSNLLERDQLKKVSKCFLQTLLPVLVSIAFYLSTDIELLKKYTGMTKDT